MMHSGRPYWAMKLCLIALQISGVVVVFKGHSVTKFETSHNRISRYFHGLPELAGSGWHVLDIHADFGQSGDINIDTFLIWSVKTGTCFQQLASATSGYVHSYVITQVWTIKAFANCEIAFCNTRMTTNK